MAHGKVALVVMAAGLGSRYGGIKQLDSVGRAGETLLEFGLFDAIHSGFDSVVFILRRDIEADFRRLVLDRVRLEVPVTLVFQDGDDLPAPFGGASPNPGRTKPWGTAQAVWACRDLDVPFAVVNADDFYGRRSYALLHDWLAAADPGRPDWAMAGYRLKNTLSDHGTVSRGICGVAQGMLTGIEEHTRLQAETLTVTSTLDDGSRVLFSPNTIVSMNMFGFTPRVFEVLEQRLRTFLEAHGTDPKAECYLPTVVGSALGTGATVRVLESPETWFGVTYQPDRDWVRQRIGELVVQGVYPPALWGLR